MSYSLEPSEKLLSPDYWDGIDINDPAHFEVPSAPSNYTTRKEHQSALGVIKACLVDVATGDYTEVKNHDRPEFNPSAERLADGTVVIFDREHLMRWTYPQNPDKKWEKSNWPNTVPISEPFAEHWRRYQSPNASEAEHHFGDEQAVSRDQLIRYGRFLEWGVLLSREDGSRLLETWAFAVPKIFELGVSMPSSYFNKFFHRADTLPLTVGRAAAKPTLKTENYTIDSIERLREIRAIHPANAARPKKEPTLAEQLREAAARLRGNLGRTALPRPIPVPVSVR